MMSRCLCIAGDEIGEVKRDACGLSGFIQYNWVSVSETYVVEFDVHCSHYIIDGGVVHMFDELCDESGLDVVAVYLSCSHLDVVAVL